jgi:Zn-dependent peptidase ImmA (M78 family)/transcriptional regulator with XRE-family HTH domain
MPSAPNLAFISPNVLRWALDRSPLPRETVANKLKVDKTSLSAWETKGEAHPPFPKAQELAKILRIPFGFLFLSEPPTIELPLPDFRGRRASSTPTLELLELLNDILVKQDWYRDYARAEGLPRLPFVGSFSTRHKVADVAADIRSRLNVSDDLRRTAATWSAYVTKLSANAEANGILVMRTSVVGHATRKKISRSEVQGFAIADNRAPLIFVNSDDFKTAQVFTLAHELAHIWIGKSAISNPDEAEPEQDVPVASPSQTIELFCNRVATEVLVPRQEFLAAWANVRSPDTSLEQLARRFWVSTLVILRRAHELGKLTDKHFFALLASERDKQTKEPAGRGDFYKNVTARMSPKFTNAVLSEVNQGRILLLDAARLLGVKVPTLIKVAEHFS